MLNFTFTDNTKLFFCVIMQFITINCIAQDFAPTGAQWYYTEGYAFYANVDYLKIESIKDTIFEGKNCKWLIKNGLLECSNRPISEIVYSQDSAVYFWDQEFSQFQTLYDFKVAKDSFWIIKIKNQDNIIDTIYVLVDSITQTNILNKNYKVLNVTYRPNYDKIDVQFYYSSKIVYAIGDFSYLFNIYPLSYLACDMNYSGGLRCYIDSKFGYYSTGIANSCTYSNTKTSIENLKTSHLTVDLYPNPTSGNIQINCQDKANYNLRLFDNLGKIIKSVCFNGKTDLDISSYSNGLYMVRIQNDKGLVITKKIVKINNH